MQWLARRLLLRVQVFDRSAEPREAGGDGGGAGGAHCVVLDTALHTQDPQPTHPVQSLITFFLCGWFITGCVWVYRDVQHYCCNYITFLPFNSTTLTQKSREFFDASDAVYWTCFVRIYWPATQEEMVGTERYCNPVVYIFAFWLITTAYIFLGLFTSCICCFSIVSVLLKREY